jgi:Tfp pilus tip-associated adhesin PilY1
MSLAAPAVDSTRLVPGNSFLYQAGFRTPQWIGNLKKFKISAVDSTNAASAMTLATTPEWEAGNLLTGSASIAASPLPAARNIYTAKLQLDSSWRTYSLKTIEFKWDKLSTDQQALLIDHWMRIQFLNLHSLRSVV